MKYVNATTNFPLLKAGMVSDGMMICHKIGYEACTVIASDGSSAVAALTPGLETESFLLTRGDTSWFVRFSSSPVENFAYIIGSPMERVDGAGVVCASDGRIYAAVYGERGGSGVETRLFVYDPRQWLMSWEMSLNPGQMQFLDCPFEGRRFSSLVIDRRSDVIYGILTDDRRLFSYSIRTGEFRELPEIGDWKFSKALVVDGNGRVWCAGQDGDVLRYVPQTDTLERTLMRVPCAKGKHYVNEATCMVFDADAGVIWGGTLLDGMLFRIDLETDEMIGLGRPSEQRHIRGVTVGGDGRVYGIVGEPGHGMCRLFRYSPWNGEMEDLGLLFACVTETWVAHEADTICTDANGHILIGENDRQSHLFQYAPSVR